MQRAPKRILYLGLLACVLTFAFSSSLHAQTETQDAPQAAAALPLPATPPVVPSTEEPAFNAEDELAAQGMERQDIREEMQRIRNDHEDLEATHDQLRTQCLNVKGQEHDECRKQWNTLRQQREALHGRVRTLHNKMSTVKQSYRGSAMINKDQPRPDENLR